jgi:alanyl-tRNA synthetase
VRHAWLLGRKEPTLVHVVQVVIESMGDVFPELRQRAAHIAETTRVEEQGFLSTIEGGLARFEQLAPQRSSQGSDYVRGTISGDDAFRLYDTYGFPIDLTELMARERGYLVDISGFDAALDAQRQRSRAERRSRTLTAAGDAAQAGEWESGAPDGDDVTFVGYDTVEIETVATAIRRIGPDRVALVLRETPFYAESGGQVSDRGEVIGDGWRVDVEGVEKIDGRPAAVGTLTGDFHFGRALARVPSDRRRDTERNHTATHLLHAALRQTLGEQVHQAGSLVAPDRMRFDFTHHGPVGAERLEVIEEIVNRQVWAATPVVTTQRSYAEARASGAMALFGEKYGDVVRVVEIPGFSMELCGGTHVRNTSEIGLFRIVSEGGVAAGVRRIEAVTGAAAYARLRSAERTLDRMAELLRVPAAGAEKRLAGLLDERRALERRLEEAMRGGGDQIQQLLARAESIVDGSRLAAGLVRAGDVRELQTLGDALREQIGSGVGVIAATFEDGRSTLLVVVSDDLRERGVRADNLVREISAVAGGKGGGKPHLAQAGIPDAQRLADALGQAPAIVRAAAGVAA